MQVRAYVAALDAKNDIAMLRERLPLLRLECLRCLEITTMVRQPPIPSHFLLRRSREVGHLGTMAITLAAITASSSAGSPLHTSVCAPERECSAHCGCLVVTWGSSEVLMNTLVSYW